MRPADLSSNAGIRDAVDLFARSRVGDSRKENLRTTRLESLCMMKLLAEYKPRSGGSVFTGQVRAGADINIYVFTDSIEAIALIFGKGRFVFDVDRKQVRKNGEETTFNHIQIWAEFPFALPLFTNNRAR